MAKTNSEDWTIIESHVKGDAKKVSHEKLRCVCMKSRGHGRS